MASLSAPIKPQDVPPSQITCVSQLSKLHQHCLPRESSKCQAGLKENIRSSLTFEAVRLALPTKIRPESHLIVGREENHRGLGDLKSSFQHLTYIGTPLPCQGNEL